MNIDSDSDSVYTCAMNENLHDPRLTIEELAERADVPVRTVRYYIAEGLLPGPGSRGKGAAYTGEHLVRLQLIRRLVARRVPLGEIRELLARLPADEAHAVLREEAQRAEVLETTAAAPSPKDYISALLAHAGGATATRPSPAAAPVRRPQYPKISAPLPPAPVATPSAGQSVPRDVMAANAKAEEAWRRWTIAPGIELQVRGDIASSREEVIERLLEAARHALNPHPQEEE